MVKMVLLSMTGLCQLGGGDGLTARWIKCCLKVCLILRVIGLFCMEREHRQRIETLVRRSSGYEQMDGVIISNHLVSFIKSVLNNRRSISKYF